MNVLIVDDEPLARERLSRMVGELEGCRVLQPCASNGEEALALARAVVQCPRLQLRGLMAIPEPAPDFAAQLAVHLRAKALFDQIQAALGDSAPAWDTLSLGMTADLEAAIAAGSTLVRVGSGIFGARAARA